jgi:hypothetical protein
MDVSATLVAITADVMHMCNRAGLQWDELAAQSERLCDHEEAETRRTSNAA